MVGYFPKLCQTSIVYTEYLNLLTLMLWFSNVLNIVAVLEALSRDFWKLWLFLTSHGADLGSHTPKSLPQRLFHQKLGREPPRKIAHY